MLTRGKLIAEILDGLGQLSFSLDTRGKLGLYDLNTYCENFTRDLMNIIYNYDLINLNEEHINESGLDLGSETKGIGIQVTTVKTSAKVNNTLEKITEEHKRKYDKFLIVILGKKQGSYGTINRELADALNFSEKDIIDINDLEKDIVSLPVEGIKKVYDFLDKELIKMYGELGFESSPSGEDTSILPSVEVVSEANFINCNKIALAIKELHNNEMSPEEMQELNNATQKLFEKLKKLPRITREFYYVVVNRSEYKWNYSAYSARDEIIKRIIKIPEYRYCEEISLLNEAGMLSCDQEDDFHINLVLNGTANECACIDQIIETARHLKLSLKEIIVDLKFILLATDAEEVQ
ncbi:SMEK domain-containing protein [Bacillus toyonensis]|uniref:SMEK domain-containing protein n=1 Tax=Bacillus toyonensis TaxID=155322 RepID=UPI002E2419B7|nr:SMEK domain-containing protein [Bacillus toyonensis]